jgi:hypothetical protein
VTQIRYLLDEHVDPRLRRAIVQQEPDLIVWCVGDAGAPERGLRDPDILRWCEDHGFILVTNNRTSMPIHVADHLSTGGHVPGVFTLQPDMSIGEIANELALIWRLTDIEEHSDAISYLPLSY